MISRRADGGPRHGQGHTRGGRQARPVWGKGEFYLYQGLGVWDVSGLLARGPQTENSFLCPD